ncbi:MAG: hypothetical protein ACOC6F_03625, partial [bacterium]
FGPDEIGSLLRQHRIPWNDGLGNGLYESLRIDRKYGLKHTLEAPIFGFEAPFVDGKWQQFRERYSQEVIQLASDVLELESVYGGPLGRRGARLMVLWTREYPLAHFLRAYQRNQESVSRELRRVIGRPLPPVRPEDPRQEATLTRFWAYVRHRQGRVTECQARVLREILGGGLKLAANTHELPPLDMASQKRAFDYPAVAIRPMLISDPLYLKYYAAYFTQLYRDLCGKPPMVSVRVNLSAATPLFIPRASLIRHWYDQAVRHGAGAFYFWTRDFPTDCNPASYDGPIPGNPVGSTLPEERWRVSLEMLGHLATHRVFRVPPAEVMILVPWDSALLHRAEWRRLYAAFSACMEAGVHTRFISDRRVSKRGIPETTRLILAPVLKFVAPSLRSALTAFAGGKGTVLLTREALYDTAGQGRSALPGATILPKELFGFFPVGGRSSVAALDRAAAWVRHEVEQRGIDDVGWVFDITCGSLPPSSVSQLREADPELTFEPWQYEHGSQWIMPYVS